MKRKAPHPLDRLALRATAWVALGLAAACGAERGDQAAGEETRSALAESVPAAIPAPRTEGGVLVVEPEEVRAWQEEGRDFVLVDTRDAVQFEREHLPGAINISYVDIRPGAALPQRDATIVVYCSDANCPISQYAYRSLGVLGYANVYDMRAGIQGWKAEGFPTVIGEVE